MMLANGEGGGEGRAAAMKKIGSYHRHSARNKLQL